MANLHAIHSVGFSLMKYLRNAYPDALKTDFPCEFKLVSSGELNTKDADFGTAVTLYLHKVTVNPYVRNNQHAGPNQAPTTPLSIDLHYLLSVWAETASVEHTILGWVLRQLYMHQTLGHSDLTSDGAWGAGDFVQVIPAELSTEDVMRIWDALDPGYRLTVPYIARVVRIDPDAVPEARPVLVRRFEVGDRDKLGGDS